MAFADVARWVPQQVPHGAPQLASGLRIVARQCSAGRGDVVVGFKEIRGLAGEGAAGIWAIAVS
jgi:hypothetical protein